MCVHAAQCAAAGRVPKKFAYRPENARASCMCEQACQLCAAAIASVVCIACRTGRLRNGSMYTCEGHVHRAPPTKSTCCRFLRYYTGALQTGALRAGGALPRARPLALAALELRGLGPHTACRVTLSQRPPAPPAGPSADRDLLPPPALEHEALEYRALPLACATAVADSGGRAAVPLQACAVQGELKVEVRGRLVTDLRRRAHCVDPSSSGVAVRPGSRSNGSAGAQTASSLTVLTWPGVGIRPLSRPAVRMRRMPSGLHGPRR